MAKLIIIRGNSGSGKSSLARKLQHKFGRNTMVIPQDTVRREMLWTHDGAGNFAQPLMIELLRYGRKNCEVVILEGILHSKWYKELFETAQAEFEQICAYYYDIPFEETLNRHATKPAEKRAQFGESEMRQWWNEKDYIGFIPEKALTKELSLDDAVELVYSEVTGGFDIKEGVQDGKNDG